MHLPLVLGWNGTGHMFWHVDASFAVHTDMKSHTGVVGGLGLGAIASMSTKQKSNTTSSTTAEIHGVSDALPFMIWHKKFLADQAQSVNGIPIGKETILYQDNEAATKMEKYGKASCSKQTRHLDVKYFYITDHVKSGDIEIQHCSTDRLPADFMTKAVQGSLFIKFRNMIMGLDEDIIEEYKISYKNYYQCSNMVSYYPHSTMG